MRRFLSIMDYFATGEGQIIEIQSCYVQNKKAAAIAHCKAFNYTKDMEKFYGVGIRVYALPSQTGKALVSQLFQNGEKLYSALVRGTADIHFKLDQNES